MEVATQVRTGVRFLKVEELLDVMPLFEKFYAISAPTEPFEVDRVMQVWTALLTSGSGTVLAGEVDGHIEGILGMNVRQSLSSSQMHAFEAVWWVNEDARSSNIGIQLLDCAERVAAERATKFLVGHFINEEGTKLNILYRRRRYAPYGIGYMKEFVNVRLG